MYYLKQEFRKYFVQFVFYRLCRKVPYSLIKYSNVIFPLTKRIFKTFQMLLMAFVVGFQNMQTEA